MCCRHSCLGSFFTFGDALKPYIRDGAVQFEPVYEEAMRHAELLKPMMADVSRELNDPRTRR